MRAVAAAGLQGEMLDPALQSTAHGDSGAPMRHGMAELPACTSLECGKAALRSMFLTQMDSSHTPRDVHVPCQPSPTDPDRFIVNVARAGAAAATEPTAPPAELGGTSWLWLAALMCFTGVPCCMFMGCYLCVSALTGSEPFGFVKRWRCDVKVALDDHVL